MVLVLLLPLIKQIRPALHHFSPLLDILRMVIGGSDLVFIGMRVIERLINKNHLKCIKEEGIRVNKKGREDKLREAISSEITTI